MSGRCWTVGACVLLAGCNLLSGAGDLSTTGDPSAGAAGDAGGPGDRDGASADVELGDAALPDAGAGAPDGPSDAAVPRPTGGRFVFVSSAQMTGKIGGIAQANAMCTTLAAKAGLGGTWIAWLAEDGSGSAQSRLTFSGSWHLVTGERVAASKAALGGSLEHAVDRTESGAAVTNGSAWTGVAPLFGLDCDGWSFGMDAIEGSIGDSSSTTKSWQASSSAACDTMHRLYCFEN
jgi:hypothetical protein